MACVTFSGESQILQLRNLLILPIGLATYLIGLVVHRLYFHPYAKYPGPFWSKISYLPAFYHAWIADTPQQQLQMHQKYGKIVRYSPDNIMFLDTNAKHDIHDATKNFVKGRAYRGMNLLPDKPSLAFTPHKREHARRRRIIGNGFTDGSMRELSPNISQHIQTFCQKMLEKEDGTTLAAGEWSKPKNMTDWTFWLSQDINTDIIMGRSYDLLTSPSLRKTGTAIQVSLQRLGLGAQYPYIFQPGIGSWFDFGTWFLPDIMQSVASYLTVGTEATMARVSQGHINTQKRRDVLQALIDTKDPETGEVFTTEDVMIESNFLMMAGGDTVGTALRIILFHLTRPWVTPKTDIVHRVQHEVRTTFSTVDEIQFGPKLDSCTYLHAVIQEALRSFAGTAFWREAGPGGAHVQGEYIPEGYGVGTSTYVIHRWPEFYPDPYHFDPNRYIMPTEGSLTNESGYTAEQVKFMKSTHHSFGLGPRGCVAKNLAWTMMMLTMARVIYQLDFEADLDKEREWLGKDYKKSPQGVHEKDFKLYGSFSLSGEGPVLRFRSRFGGASHPLFNLSVL